MIPLIYQEDVVETISVKRTGRIFHPYNESISYNCHLSKNVWNQAQHIVDGEYKEFGHVPSYEDVDAMLNDRNYYKNSDFDNYHKLGGAQSQQILKVHNKAWKSCLMGKKGYFDEDNPKKDNYTGKPNKPGYKKKDGEFILKFTNQQIKFRENKDGSVYMLFPKNKGKGLKDKDGKPLKILLGNVNDIDSYLINKLMWGKFDEVRIIPAGTGYWIEIVYDEEVIKNPKYQLDKNIIMTIDLGVENLAAITDNIGSQPIIIKSEILKAENQWYNKRRAELQAIYDRQKIGCKLPKIDKNGERKFKTGFIGKYITDQYGIKIGCKLPKKTGEIIDYITNKNGKKIKILTENRNNFVMDSEHKVSRFIIERALHVRAGTIVFGKNPLWKQQINLGKRNNQNFVNLPLADIIKKTQYKGEELGIDVLGLTEEYTSKCSFLESESLEHHDVYIGKRMHRGLFKTSKGIKIGKKIIDTINADVQGSYNLQRKVNPKFSINTIMEGIAVHGLVPKRLSISDLMIKSYENLRMSYRLHVGNINNVNCHKSIIR